MSQRPTVVRKTFEIDADLVELLARRADEVDQPQRNLVQEALRAFLGAPLAAANQHVPTPNGMNNALASEVRALVAEVRALTPDLRAVVANHAELMDAVDELASELGRRIGAGEALDEASRIASRRP